MRNCLESGLIGVERGFKKTAGAIDQTDRLVPQSEVCNVSTEGMGGNLRYQRISGRQQPVIEACSHFADERAIYDFIRGCQKHSGHYAKKQDHSQSQGQVRHRKPVPLAKWCTDRAAMSNSVKTGAARQR